jgi:hypothetical protein
MNIIERSTEEVFEDHLRQSVEGSIETDLARNYAQDLVILTGRGIYRGHHGLRQLAKLLNEQLQGASMSYCAKLVDGEFAFLEWTAESAHARVEDGADSYVVRDGRIIAQTIHYTVKPR